MRRAQTATEYLVIIAVVIIIALIVINVLGGVPSIGGSSSSKINDLRLANADVGVVAYSISEDGATIFLRNNLADTILINNITIGGEVCTPFTPVTLLPGQEVEVFCESILEVVDESYSVPIVIDYTNSKTTARYSQDDPEYILSNKFAETGYGLTVEPGFSNWSQLGSDIDGEAASDNSGWSVSVSSDGSIVAIGAIYNNGAGSDAGHVRVYEYSGGTWSQLGSDIDGEAAGDLSGYSVSLSSDGSIVAIGASYNDGAGSDAGHVRVYGGS